MRKILLDWALLAQNAEYYLGWVIADQVSKAGILVKAPMSTQRFLM